MNYALHSIALTGLEGRLVRVEVDIQRGLPIFQIVGLADKAVQEARVRVTSAIKNAGFKMPLGKVYVNLAPADILKTGSCYDLPIALAILMASNQIRPVDPQACFWGELALSSETCATAGALAVTIAAKDFGLKTIYLPHINAPEAGIVAGINIKPLKTLTQLRKSNAVNSGVPFRSPINNKPSFKEGFNYLTLNGHEMAKRGLAISAAGGHNIIFSGPPGTGKSMLGKALRELLPDLSERESFEVMKVYSVAGLLNGRSYIERPFRSPHHTISKTALIGGGANPQPGEISLAHKGVLFLDEFLEFNPSTLDSLRQPLEDKYIDISRLKQVVRLPSDFILAAAINPCKCGYFGDKSINCVCSASEIERYRRKITGPIIDRIDIRIWVPRIDSKELLKNDILTQDLKKKDFVKVKEDITEARDRQFFNSLKRWKRELTNSELSTKQILECIDLNSRSESLIELADKKYHLSSRAIIKCLKVAKTIAELEKKDSPDEENICEALSLRTNNW